MMPKGIIIDKGIITCLKASSLAVESPAQKIMHLGLTTLTWRTFGWFTLQSGVRWKTDITINEGHNYIISKGIYFYLS